MDTNVIAGLAIISLGLLGLVFLWLCVIVFVIKPLLDYFDF